MNYSKTDININIDYLTFSFDTFEFLKNDIKNLTIWLSANSDFADFKYSFNNLEYNINIKTIKIYWYTRFFDFSIIAENEKSITLFQIYFWWFKWNISTRSKLEIKGSFFQLFWKDEVFNFLLDKFNINKIDKILRFDIAVDIPENKKNLEKTFIDTPTSQLNYNKLKQEFETIYFWFRGDTKYILRIYDKILDSVKKNKIFMYDFKDYKDLTRLELEFGEKEIDAINNINKNKINIYSLFDSIELIKNLFLSYISKHISFFSLLEYQKYNIKYTQPKRIDLQSFVDIWALPPRWSNNAVSIMQKFKNIIWFKKFLELLKFNTDDFIILKNHLLNLSITKISKKIEKFDNKIIHKDYKNIYRSMFDDIEKIQNNSKKTFELLLNNNLSISTEFNIYIEKALKDYLILNPDLKDDKNS